MDVTLSTAIPDSDGVGAIFARLRAASRRDPFPDLATRKDRLGRLLSAMTEDEAAIEAAISADFGHRCVQETRLAEAFIVEAGIKHTLRHLKGWMKPKRVKTELAFLPGRNRLMPQPLGLVGVVAPWNYPLQLTLAPLAAALSAGNRVMIKPSELTPRFSALLAEILSRRFGDDEVVVVQGGPDVASAFTALPFDHLLFTGSTRVGRMVAEAAAKNLTPVTLELGGKSPAILDASADVANAASRIAFSKMLNAGQTCVAPDYVLLPKGREAAFVAAYRGAVAKLIGEDPSNPDYTAIVCAPHRQRQQALVDDAVAKGAKVEWAVGDPTRWSNSAKFPPCVLLDTTPDMRVRQEEIFGPILPVVPVGNADEAIATVVADERPLALYWFGTDAAARDKVMVETVSGGVTVNDCLVHLAQENQPFGGVGASGMGAYHGEWGFRTFSHLKPIFHRPDLSGLGFMQPPYGKTFDRMLAALRRFA
ncbi:coniferyl aldehyde dehydrogenase [Pinisolibacter sp.]|uniref:coniferyl aldehyde dehydrogenase n=1 Tax=Pinisolibacter sp. TaxID=2172024 RepID=UPI002FDE2EC8